MLTPEEIESNFLKFREYCENKTGDRSTNILNLIDKLGMRLAIAPASAKKEHHCAYPGGLIDHSLHVLGNALILNKSFGWKQRIDSIVIASLFHDLGKCTHLISEEEYVDYYITQDSDWHKQKLGQMYKHNDDIPYMTVPHRSVWILQQFDVKLTYDEYIAIMIHDGFSLPENARYCLHEPVLSHIIMTADYISTLQEKITLKKEEVSNKTAIG